MNTEAPVTDLRAGASLWVFHFGIGLHKMPLGAFSAGGGGRRPSQKMEG
jgi:hypothetical protein